MRWAILRLGAVLACGFAVCACEPESETLPSEMLQIWHSDAPRYQGRSFELRSDWVVYGTGGAGSALHQLEHVASEAISDGGRLYTIRYKADDGENTVVQLRHYPGPKMRLIFANHDEVWTPGQPGLLEGL
jgi:hypothetical protein